MIRFLNHEKKYINCSFRKMQVDPSGWLKPPIDLSLTALAAAVATTAQGGWRTITNPSQ